MPRNPLKTFGRRKSSSNILDVHLATNEPKASQSSDSTFRVLDRPPSNAAPIVDSSKSARAGTRRPFNSPLSHLRLGKSADDLGSFTNRGSAGTTHSGSSYHYDSSSARHSSSSTLPSSVDPERDPEDEDLFPRKAKSQPMNSAALDNPLPPPPSFTTRATRAFSFGSKSSRHEPVDVPPVPPIPPLRRETLPKEDIASRDRATTVSSYASTAIPNTIDTTSPGLQLAGVSTSFGDDFGSMFAGIGKEPKTEQRQRDQGNELSPRTVSKVGPACPATKLKLTFRKESEPMFPARAFSRTGRTPSPNPALLRRMTDSPYSFEAQDSDNLMPASAQSPPLESAPPPPSHATNLARKFLGTTTEYAPIPERYSPGIDTPLESPISVPDMKSTGRRPSIQTPKNEMNISFGAGSNSVTPRAVNTENAAEAEDSLFDLAASARHAIHNVQPNSTSKAQKRMTTAEFERLRYGNAQKEPVVEEDAIPEDDYDDQDEAERARELTRQRRKQEANMAVYRQQMKKVTGGGPSDLPSTRPNYDRMSSAASSPMGIHLGGLNGAPPADSIRGKAGADDEDDDVPLGILQAHGFPSASRPPIRQEDGDAYSQKRASVAGSVYGGVSGGHNSAGGGGGGRSLPPFARRLPADPYYGAGIVNQSNRESMAFSPTSAQPPVMGHPGGLVGVIAGEERARAARRGSPNPTSGAYDQPMPLPSNMQSPHQGGSQRMSMMNANPAMPYGAAPLPGMPMPPNQAGMGSMFGMPGMPQFPTNVPQEQMQQFMQMQMQLMQNMLAIQQQTLGQSPQQAQAPMTQDYLGVPGPTPRPMSSMSSFGRPMSQAMNSFDASTSQRPTSAVAAGYTPSVFGMSTGGPGPGYTPSIAPSERSNIGMPSRYRPVSMLAPDNQYGRSQSMTSNATLQAFDRRSSMFPAANPTTNTPNERPVSTIRVIDKPKGMTANRPPGKSAASGEHSDEEESGWAEMAKKRTEKKWSWRKKSENPKQKEQEALRDLYQGLDS